MAHPTEAYLRPRIEEIAVYGCALTYSTGLMMGLLLIPFYGEHFQFSAITLGILVGFAGLFLTLLRIPAGFLVDRFGSRIVVITAVIAQLLSAPFLLMAHTDWTSPIVALGLAQLLAGSSRAAFWPAKQAFLVDWPHQTSSWRFGRLSASDSIAQIAGPALVGLVANAFGLFAASLTFLVVSLLAVAFSLMLPRLESAEQGAEVPANRPLASLKVVATSGPVYLGALAAFSAGIPMIAFGSFAPLFLFSVGYSATAVGLLVSVRGLAMVVFSTIYVRLFDSGEYRSPWFWSMSALTLGFAAVPLFTGALPLSLAIALIGLGAGVVQVLSMVVVGDLAPRSHVGMAMAYSGLYRSVSVFITPLVLGVAVEYWGLASSFWILAAVFLVGASMSGPIVAKTVGDRR